MKMKKDLHIFYLHITLTIASMNSSINEIENISSNEMLKKMTKTGKHIERAVKRNNIQGLLTDLFPMSSCIATR